MNIVLAKCFLIKTLPIVMHFRLIQAKRIKTGQTRKLNLRNIISAHLVILIIYFSVLLPEWVSKFRNSRHFSSVEKTTQTKMMAMITHVESTRSSRSRTRSNFGA